ncbi:hypothetical protein BDV19DRAFT_394063 [Aspergillus venezuelensis]
MPSVVIFYAALLSLGASASINNVKRWVKGGSATGPTVSDVVSGCTYWANDIAAYDTCAALQDYFGITVEQLAAWNPSLSSSDCMLVVGNSYCVEAPHVPPPSSTTTTSTTKTTSSGGPSSTQTGLEPSCDEFHLVATGDACFDLAVEYGISLQQFHNWNPAVGTTCSGLQAGYYRMLTYGTCDKFYAVEEGNTCGTIASDNGITLPDFYAWNPAVGTDCSALWAGYYACIGVTGGTTTTSKTTATSTTSTATGPSPTQTGIIETCTGYYQAQSGETYSSIVSGRYSYVPLNRFITWNPAVESSCSGLWAGYFYCVATEAWMPQPGTVTACRAYHRVVRGDTCQIIQQRYGITTAQFNRWNPSVGQDCASLWAGYFVCVGV